MSDIITKISNECLECGACVKKCEYLSRHCDKSPVDLVKKVQLGEMKDNISAIFTCNLCDLCEEVCPVDLNMGALSLELRQEYRERNGEVSKVHQPLLGVQKVYVSPEVKAAIPGTKNRLSQLKGEETVFFPGCSLSLNSPHLVKSTFSFLQEKIPGIGILTGCCGAPTHLIGEQKVSEEIYQDIVQRARAIGAKTIIAACCSCVKLLQSKLPQDIQAVSLYEVLGEFSFQKRDEPRKVFNIHDACSARRFDSVQAAVRKIITDLGYKIEEIKHSKKLTQCCGMGGMASIVDGQYSATVARRTLKEVNQNLIVYCATCRVNFSTQGAKTIHLLELLFNENWEDELEKAPRPFEESVTNLSHLKNYFEKVLL